MKTLLSKELSDKLKLSVSVNNEGDFVLAAVVESGVLLDALAKQIPGQVDDALLGLVKGYLQKLGAEQQGQ